MKIVVFAGGVGTRLWPLSRKNSPKQFGQVIGDQSTLQQTVSRLLPSFSSSDIYIATGERYKDIVREQLPEIPNENFIFEPEMRDVGPALGLASFLLERKYADEAVAVVWSDHLVKNDTAFRDALLLAEQNINDKKAAFVFIAQKPRFANQNMGWIEQGAKVSATDGITIHTFKRFKYRPKLSEAEEFFANENYAWNLGYFVTTPSYLTSLFKHFAPAMAEKLQMIQQALDTNHFEQTLREIYPTLEKITFDEVILEKMSPENIFVISQDLKWSDVGAWESLKEALAETEEENVVKGNVLLEDSSDSLVFNFNKSEKQLVVGIDLQGMIIINTEDVLLVCPKGSVPKIKKLVENLKGTLHEQLT